PARPPSRPISTPSIKKTWKQGLLARARARKNIKKLLAFRSTTKTSSGGKRCRTGLIKTWKGREISPRQKNESIKKTHKTASIPPLRHQKLRNPQDTATRSSDRPLTSKKNTRIRLPR
ncbi:unnamed protein product, partial [Ectocarpus sp. 8 AP-2014]